MNKSISAVAAFCLTLMMAPWLTRADEPATLPPLSAAGSAHLPGKFVWADHITSQFDTARDFYIAFLDLDWELIDEGPSRYGILSHDGYAVAGIAEHEKEGDSEYGHWVHFMSVHDLDDSIDTLTRSGGKVELAQQEVPDRGRLAIAKGPHGEVIGLLRSSSGDPADYRAERGDWLWRELLSHDPVQSATIYSDLCDCTVFEDSIDEGRFLIASQGYLRAAISALDEAGSDAVWLGFVQVHDLKQAAQEARELGAEVVVAPDPGVLDGQLAVIRDPAGAHLGLIAWGDFAEEGS